MDFDFDHQFPKPTHSKANRKQSKNLQEIMNDINNSSVDFDNFDPIDQNPSIDKSNTSELFNKPKLPSAPSSKQKSNVQFQQDTSRDIEQISLYFNNTNQGFHFQKSVSYEQPSRNDRYENLKKLLQKAKKNSLDAFYKNIEMTTANQKQQQGNIVFEDKNQFKSYLKDLKNAKKIQEDKFYNKVVVNQQYQGKPKQSKKANLFGKQGEDAFKKKYNTDFNILPPQFNQEDEDQNVDFFNPDHFQPKGYQKQEVQYRKQKFNQQKLQYFQEGKQFFSSNQRNSSKPTSKKASLQPIRQQKVNILDHSMQEKNLKQLLINYEDMKNNFTNLIGDLKEANQKQTQFANDLRNVKGQYRTVLSVQERQRQKQQKQKEKLQKKKQLQYIKNQIHQIKTNQKDLAYNKINEKLEQLENVVRVVIQQIAEEKTQKFTPKVINYYDDDNEKQKSQSNRSRQDNQQPNFSRDSQNLYQNIKNASNNTSPKKTIKREDSRSNLNGKQNYRPTQKGQQKVAYSQNVSRDLNFLDEFSSPLQLDLSLDANRSNAESEDVFDIRFIPAQFGLQYLPMKIQASNKQSYRNCLSQKSSILYQSFQFLIACRYTIIQDDKYPVVANIRVGNKCAIDLIDVFVIVYGPQGSDVEVTPNKIFQQKMKYNSHIQFQVRLDKRCIDDNGFSINVSYKTDSMTKKKINFKAVLPIIQLIKPQFIYEENFIDSWELLKNQVYITPKKLDFKQIRNHQDLKLLLPFIHISQQDPNIFSYGIMFKYPKSPTTFMLKIMCYVNGKASIHLRADRNGDQKLKEELLNIFNFLLFA